MKESHCDSFYNNNIHYLHFSDLIISVSSSFFPSILLAVWFSTQGHRKSVPVRYVRAAIVAAKRYHTASIKHLQQPSPAKKPTLYINNKHNLIQIQSKNRVHRNRVQTDYSPTASKSKKIPQTNNNNNNK